MSLEKQHYLGTEKRPGIPLDEPPSRRRKKTPEGREPVSASGSLLTVSTAPVSEASVTQRLTGVSDIAALGVNQAQVDENSGHHTPRCSKTPVK